jgi:hypothetical protein
MVDRLLVLLGILGLACGEESGRTRDETSAAGGGAPATGSTKEVPGAGTPTGGAAAIGDGTDGEVASAPSLDVGNLGDLELGEPLQFVATTGMVPYAIGANPYGIQGSGFLAQSRLGNTITIGTDPGEICIRGNLDEVPLNPDGHGDYGQYWGVELGFNLNDAVENSDYDAGLPSPVSDADAAATTPMATALPWHPGKVVGFSFVIEGATINLIRFKSLPSGVDSSLESNVYCKELNAKSGAPNNVLLNELSTYCWSGTNSILPIGGGLANISWQLPADVAPAGSRPFDWCLTELRPILTQP